MSRPQLTRLLTLEARVAAPDGAGGQVEDWRPLGAHWADLRPSAAYERSLGGIEANLVTHRITVRWSPFEAPSRPRAAQRFREGARVFDILGVAEADADAAFLTVWAREGAPR